MQPSNGYPHVDIRGTPIEHLVRVLKMLKRMEDFKDIDEGIKVHNLF